MSKLRFEWNSHRVWLALFGGWMVLLSGILNPWVGGPGMLQWVRLKALLSQRQDSLAEIENQVLALSSEQVRLERNPASQQREIRRVLGYVRSDELIFDFSSQLPVAGPASTRSAARRGAVARR